MTKDLGFEFEFFLRYELPKLLNLSPSKRVAMELKFQRFRDHVRPLVEEMPQEFGVFFEEMRETAKKVLRFRPPRGYKTIPYWDKDTGEMRYGLGKTIPTPKLNS